MAGVQGVMGDTGQGRRGRRNHAPEPRCHEIRRVVDPAPWPPPGERAALAGAVLKGTVLFVWMRGGFGPFHEPRRSVLGMLLIGVGAESGCSRSFTPC